RSGELARIPRAHWNLEMGTLAEIVNQHPAGSRAVLFDEIPDYPPGMRVLSGATNSMKRLAVTLGFPVPSHPLDVVRAYRDRMQTHKPIPPRVVKSGPILENVQRGDAIDILKFPAPFLPEHNRVLSLGTGDLFHYCSP